MNEIFDLIDKIIRPAEDWGVGANEKLAAEARLLVSSLSRNRAGRVVLSIENLKKLRELNRIVKNIFSAKDFQDLAKELDGSLKELSKTVDGYFAKAFDLPCKYSEKALFAFLIEEAASQTKASFLAPSLADNLAVALRNSLSGAIQSGATIEQLIQTVNTQLTQGGQPFLSRYAGQIANDAVTQFGRNYINAYAQDLDLVWYLYEGKPIATSRAFCVKRANKFYHRSEVESWAELSWQGKIPGTNAATIFTLGGGYNCRHFLIPVPESSVPESVRARI